MACPVRGQAGQRNIRIHSRQDRRFLCTECHQTFTATKGTAFYRLRTSAETVTRVVTRMAHGCPLPASVVACGLDERTVADWLGRAGIQGQAVPQHLVEQPRDLGEVHADEIRVKQQGGIVWMALALRVSPRVWRAGEVSEPRALPLIRRLIERVHACARKRPILFCTDGVCSDVRAVRETFREAIDRGTPAMAAGITDHGWSVRALLSFHVPPPRWIPPKRRGRPSRALQHLIERWCS